MKIGKPNLPVFSTTNILHYTVEDSYVARKQGNAEPEMKLK